MVAGVEHTNQMTNLLVYPGICGVSCYLGALLITGIPATAGAVFGATAAIVNSVAEPIFKAIFAGPEASDASKRLSCIPIILTDGVCGAFSANLATGYMFTIPAAYNLVIPSMVIGVCFIFAPLKYSGCGETLGI